MKIALIVMTILFSSFAFGESMELSFKDKFEIKKVVMDEILINDLIRLHNDYDFDGERMVAGHFEVSEKKTPKKSYLDNLRSKLQGHKGLRTI